jgi:hypothetical protein
MSIRFHRFVCIVLTVSFVVGCSRPHAAHNRLQGGSEARNGNAGVTTGEVDASGAAVGADHDAGVGMMRVDSRMPSDAGAHEDWGLSQGSGQAGAAGDGHARASMSDTACSSSPGHKCV